METADKRSCYLMRYVMAMLGSAAFALLFLLKHNESAGMRYWVDRVEYISSLNVNQQIILGRLCGVGFIALPLFAIFCQKLSAKWAIMIIMTLQLYQSLALKCPLSFYYKTIWGFMSGVVDVLSGNVCFVAMHVLISNWSPPNERSLITSIIYSGYVAAVGYTTILTNYYQDVPADILILCCFVWMGFWCILIEDSPGDRKQMISKYEKDYIRISIKTYQPQPDPNNDMSLRDIIFSKAFVAMTFIECCSTFIQTTLIDYISESNKTGAFITEAGYICSIVFMLIWGFFTTFYIQRRVTSFDVSRKISSIIATAIPFSLFVVSFILTSYSVHEICSIIAYVFIGAKYSGAIINIVDMAPNYAAVLMTVVQIANRAIVPIAFVISGIISSIFNTYDTIMMITVMAAVVVLSAIFYWFWGSTSQKTVTSTESVSTVEDIHSNLLDTEIKEPLEEYLEKPLDI